MLYLCFYCFDEVEGKKINKPGAKERADALWDTMMRRLLEYKEKVCVCLNDLYSLRCLGLICLTRCVYLALSMVTVSFQR